MYCMTVLYPKDDITPEDPPKRSWVVIGTVVLTVILLLGFMVCAYFGIKQLSSIDNPTPQHELSNTEKPLHGTQDIASEDTREDTQQTGSMEETEPPVESKQEILSEDGQENIQQPVNTVKPVNPTTQPQTTPTKTPANNTTTDPTKKPETNTTTEPTKQTQNTQPQSCNHYYTAATCIAPMSCTICGDTVGTVNTSAHIWKPITAVVHHEEVGHYEIVEEYYKKTIYLCFFDGYNQEGFESLEELRNHMPVHSNKIDYNYVMSVPDMLANTREIWATRPVEQWVVDQKAYDETIVTGYICTVCNAKKDP